MISYFVVNRKKKTNKLDNHLEAGDVVPTFNPAFCCWDAFSFSVAGFIQ